MSTLDGVIESMPGGRVKLGPWTVVDKRTGQEALGAYYCCTGTEQDARGTAAHFNRQCGEERYEAVRRPDTTTVDDQVSRYRAALERISYRPCLRPPPRGECGDCVTCEARTALKTGA